MPTSVTSVSIVSGKLGLVPVLHTLNTGDWCWGISINISCNTASRGCGFLDATITLCPLCHRSVKIVDMSDERTDQSMRTTLFC